jgi:hypothetical protein
MYGTIRSLAETFSKLHISKHFKITESKEDASEKKEDSEKLERKRIIEEARGKQAVQKEAPKKGRIDLILEELDTISTQLKAIPPAAAPAAAAPAAAPAADPAAPAKETVPTEAANKVYCELCGKEGNKGDFVSRNEPSAEKGNYTAHYCPDCAAKMPAPQNESEDILSSLNHVICLSSFLRKKYEWREDERSKKMGSLFQMISEEAKARKAEIVEGKLTESDKIGVESRKVIRRFVEAVELVKGNFKVNEEALKLLKAQLKNVS